MSTAPDHQGLMHYLSEAAKQKQRYVDELEQLRADLAVDNFRSRDYLATERLLQVLTELSIGLAKHCCKRLTGQSAVDAYQTFSHLAERGFLTVAELAEWKKIIGFRNGLVHDYLNIDLLIIANILSNAHYLRVAQFCDQAIEFLASDTP
ncbi:type VII toxin-antitoxin system HepT family RNase toxin [Salinibius halmophilus]|uniref:type VII toxin-antitoxin system HepT family RNase toxin n=1 Tax=Salinibius halmophilus TaxID=1853216 RepID=UPI000E675BA2|nr:DUF86 domain-containing protein [Salinibius halmophilus]